MNIENPNTPLTHETLGTYLTGPTKAGVYVDTERALSLSAVWRAVSILGETVASLPLELTREDRQGNLTQDHRHPAYRLVVEEPNALYTKFDFLQTLVIQAALNGNSYGFLDRPSPGAPPRSIWIPDPSEVTPYLNEKQELLFGHKGMDVVFPARDVIHIKGLTWNGITGIDIIRWHAENFGLALANRDYGSNFYGNGAHLSGVIEHPGKLSRDAMDRLRSSWKSRYSGVNNAGATPILEEGMKYSRIGLNPNDASFADTHKLTLADIARIFGVPQFLLEDLDRATFNNIEHMSQMFVRHTILPWTERITNELNRKLFNDSERRRYRFRFVMTGLMRGDTESRGKYYQALFQVGAMSPNDIRRQEGLNPVADGDRYYVPMNFTATDAPPAPAPTEPTGEPAADTETPQTETDGATQE